MKNENISMAELIIKLHDFAVTNDVGLDINVMTGYSECIVTLYKGGKRRGFSVSMDDASISDIVGENGLLKHIEQQIKESLDYVNRNEPLPQTVKCLGCPYNNMRNPYEPKFKGCGHTICFVDNDYQLKEAE